MNNQEKVLVTGASGYIALHCISELLNEGYKVKGSLRDLSKETQVRKSLERYGIPPQIMKFLLNYYKKSYHYCTS